MAAMTVITMTAHILIIIVTTHYPAATSSLGTTTPLCASTDTTTRRESMRKVSYNNYPEFSSRYLTMLVRSQIRNLCEKSLAVACVAVTLGICAKSEI